MTVDRVIRGEALETVAVYGRVVSRQAGIVAVRVRGAVAEVKVDVGHRVKKGDVLIVLLSDMLEAERELKTAELAEYRARIVTSQASLGLAEQELARLERLRRSAAFSSARFEDKRREVERFRSAVAETSARAKQAEAALHMAEINLRDAVVRAPYDGVITKRHIEAGVYLSVGDKVVTMTNDHEIEIEAEVPAARLSGLTSGRRVLVDPEISKPFEATVRAVVPEENLLSRTRTVRFIPVENGERANVAVNQSVVLRIPADAPRVVTTAHKDALLHRGGQTAMFVYREGKVQFRPVTIGDAFGNRFEIVSGLEPGEMVVTRGNERLRPNQEVRIRGVGRPGGGPGRGGAEGGRRGGGPAAGSPSGAREGGRREGGAPQAGAGGVQARPASATIGRDPGAGRASARTE